MLLPLQDGVELAPVFGGHWTRDLQFVGSSNRLREVAAYEFHRALWLVLALVVRKLRDARVLSSRNEDGAIHREGTGGRGEKDEDSAVDGRDGYEGGIRSGKWHRKYTAPSSTRRGAQGRVLGRVRGHLGIT